jgi:hypothetical protein
MKAEGKKAIISYHITCFWNLTREERPHPLTHPSGDEVYENQIKRATNKRKGMTASYQIEKSSRKTPSSSLITAEPVLWHHMVLHWIGVALC